MSFTLVVHHRGVFVSDPFLRYKGGDGHAFYNLEIDNWSYFEAMSIVKELGYLGGVKLWWRVGGPDVIEHLPGPELVKEDQVQKGDQCGGEEVLNEVCQDEGSDQNMVGRAEVLNGVNSEDKGKTTELEDEVGDHNESIDSGSENGESIDDLKDVCFEDSEEERNLGNDDGFGDIEIPIPHNEGTSDGMPSSQNEGNS
ncbi:hypothetical protein SESBI_45976 [Sesbania bispinosa]|nr:hypothetical protein SESBI_45976 [Sesbania bispinosa]